MIPAFSWGQQLPGPNEPIWQQWQALLHYNDGSPRITDPEFLLSSPRFNLKAEWLETFKLISSDDERRCKFPARYRLMSQWYSDTDFPPLSGCSGYKEFIAKAPADYIDLVYASENLVNPSSMMGHTMLVINGKRANGFLAKHSISFFTELDSSNPFEIFYDTFLVGKSGYFLVQPMKEAYQFYNVQEQRNVWEYRLKLSKYQRQLVHDHLWELKHPTIDYFFQSHNCATLILDILKTANPKLDSQGWISPIDVAKSVQEENMILSTQVKPGTKWKIKMLEGSLSETSIEQVYNTFYEGAPLNISNNKSGFLQKELLESLLKYNVELSKVRPEDLVLEETIKHVSFSNDFYIDLSTYKSPLLTPDDSQYSIGLRRADSENAYEFRWMPASHTLEDNNQDYFGENELKLTEITFLVDQDTGHGRLSKFELYSAKSLTPRDQFTGGLSGYLRMGYYPQYDGFLELDYAVEVSGGVGRTVEMSDNIGTYALLGLGYTPTSETNSFIEPEIGTYIYFNNKYKTAFNYQARNNFDGEWLNKFNVNFSILMKGSTVRLEASHFRIQGESVDEYSFNWIGYY